MRRLGYLLLISCFVSDLQGEEANSSPLEEAASSFRPFTGKVTRNKVRLRLYPSLEAPILRELDRDELLVVLGEADEFYAVRPPQEIRGYVYRTLVLDDVVEGSRVNVRLEPSLEAPVIGQLESGDKVEGKVSALSSKWLEIAPPDSTRFFVCKDYVELVGDAEMISKLTQRRLQVNQLLEEAYQLYRTQLSAPFDQINIQLIQEAIGRILADYQEFPDQLARAKELLTAAEDEYLKKRVGYLEEQNASKSHLLHEQQARLKEVIAQKRAAKMIEKASVANSSEAELASALPKRPCVELSPSMLAWQPVEEAYWQNWCQQEGLSLSIEQMYDKQRQEACLLRGTIEPYTRQVRNKPGDFVLLNPNRQPIAYLYSTRVDLQKLMGQKVVLQGSLRPNNRFAFPAYFVVDRVE